MDSRVQNLSEKIAVIPNAVTLQGCMVKLPPHSVTMQQSAMAPCCSPLQGGRLQVGASIRRTIVSLNLPAWFNVQSASSQLVWQTSNLASLDLSFICLLVCLFLCFGTHLSVLRNYSSLSAQGSLLVWCQGSSSVYPCTQLDSLQFLWVRFFLSTNDR